MSKILRFMHHGESHLVSAHIRKMKNLDLVGEGLAHDDVDLPPQGYARVPNEAMLRLMYTGLPGARVAARFLSHPRVWARYHAQNVFYHWNRLPRHALEEFIPQLARTIEQDNPESIRNNGLANLRVIGSRKALPYLRKARKTEKSKRLQAFIELVIREIKTGKKINYELPELRRHPSGIY
ncbi:MAG TPA: hypothetical protein VGQ00_03040 [Candidatus Norongarragalinales archaeon]|jgi:hypothetical protein|nr:hypothetical protein [Candidatus Norongarragalinales archaeon]